MPQSLVLELVRQFLRWLGVWAMTIGVPESIAGLTTHEDAVVALTGLVMYALADTGWLVVKWKAFRQWLDMRQWRRGE